MWFNYFLQAKTWLRRKKQVEKNIEKRANALENIQGLLDRLRQVESDALVMESYKVGVAALRRSLAIPGLTLDDADNTVDALKDVLDVAKDVDDTLALPLDEDVDVDLDAELAALLEGHNDGPEPSAGDTSGAANALDLTDLANTPTPATTVPNDEDEEAGRSLEARLRALSS